jgi:hypothetical protein
MRGGIWKGAKGVTFWGGTGSKTYTSPWYTSVSCSDAALSSASAAAAEASAPPAQSVGRSWPSAAGSPAIGRGTDGGDARTGGTGSVRAHVVDDGRERARVVVDIRTQRCTCSAGST